MKRREFISLLGGAAAWPLAAGAQQAERMRRIGVLMNTTANTEQQQSLVAFQQALQRLGWTEGRNVQMDVRWAGGDAREIRRHAGELVALAPDVIVATGNAGMVPLLQATRIIPIVFNNVADPVGGGFVKSMARPGGNATGFIQFEYSLSAKWLETLKEIIKEHPEKYQPYELLAQLHDDEARALVRAAEETVRIAKDGNWSAGNKR